MLKSPDAVPGASLALRVRPFCQRIGISPASFYKYVGLGKIRVVKIAGRTLIPAAEVDRLLREGTAPNLPTA